VRVPHAQLEGYLDLGCRKSDKRDSSLKSVLATEFKMIGVSKDGRKEDSRPPKAAAHPQMKGGKKFHWWEGVHGVSCLSRRVRIPGRWIG